MEITIILNDTIRSLSPYFADFRGNIVSIPDKPFVRGILEGSLRLELLSIEDLRKCITTCVYFELDSTRFTQELFRNISRTRSSFANWFTQNHRPGSLPQSIMLSHGGSRTEGGPSGIDNRLSHSEIPREETIERSDAPIFLRHTSLKRQKTIPETIPETIQETAFEGESFQNVVPSAAIHLLPIDQTPSPRLDPHQTPPSGIPPRNSGSSARNSESSTGSNSILNLRPTASLSFRSFLPPLTSPRISLSTSILSGTNDEDISGEDADISWSVSADIEEPVRSELVKVLGANLDRQKLADLGCDFLQFPGKGSISSSGNTLLTSRSKVPSKGSVSRSHRRTARLLNICTLLLDNQDAPAKQMAAEILKEMGSDDVKDLHDEEPLLGLPLDDAEPKATSPEPDYDEETFTAVEFDDENIPLAGTPEIPRNQNRHRSVINSMWLNPIYPQNESINIPNVTVLGSVFNLHETTIVNILAGTREMVPVISSINTICYVVILLAFFGTIAPGYTCFVLISYPIIFLRISLMNLYLVKQLLRSFETWFLLVQISIETIALVDMFQGDVRCIGALYLVLIQMTALFYDAALISSKERIVNLSIVILYIIMIVVTLYMDFWKYTPRTVSFGGYINSTTEDIFAQRILTMIIFSAKHIVNAYYHPDCFVILTSRLSRSSVRVVHRWD